MADVPVPSIVTATPAAADTVLGVQGGAVKRFSLSALPFAQAGAGAVSRTVQIKNRELISVADFGVVGDGVTDDTAAMATAIAAVKALYAGVTPTYGSTIVRAPSLFIPNGLRIKVSGNLDCPPAIVSQGFAIIECSNPANDIFVGVDIYRFYANGIGFIGGKTQIRLSNSNLNFGLWHFEKCTFSNSADYAVQALNTSVTYDVTSTQLVFNNCRWNSGARFLKTECDHAYVNGGWMQLSADTFPADTAAIWNGGMLSMNEVMCVPFGAAATRPTRSRWIDNHGAVRCHQTRFGGESGGIPVVYHFAPPVRYTAGTPETVEAGISFSQCTLYGGEIADTDASIINLRGELPVVVRITDCTGPISGPYIRNESADGGIADIGAYLAALKIAWNNDDLRAEIGFHFRGNKARYDPTAPALWPSELNLYAYTDRPFTPRVCKLKSSTTQAVPTGALTVLALGTAEYDPHSMKLGNTVKVLPGAQFARVTGYVEISSHSANNLIYNVRVFRNGVNVPDAYVNYLHEIAGQVRIQVVANVACAANDAFDLRMIQSSGTDKTVALASLTAEFL